MTSWRRAIIELEALAYKLGGGLSINYCSFAPTIIDGIPNKWSTQVGRTDKEHYTGYGVTMDLSVLDCYRKWQEA